MKSSKKNAGKVLGIIVSATLVLSLATLSAEAKAPATTTLPFVFPTVKLPLKAGDIVLAPPLQMITDSAKDPANAFYIFYNDTVVAPGDTSTKVKELSGDVSIPNALIVPIKAGQSAKKGDIVLTWWQTGAGLQRAIVLEGGKTPKVSYLNLLSDVEQDTLAADSFNVLLSNWQAGTTLACKDSYNIFNQVILINMSGNKVLTSGWAGMIKVYSKTACLPAPIKNKIKTGDTVYVAPYGTYIKAKVTSVDQNNGKFKAKYMFSGISSEDSFYFGNFFTSMPKIK